MVDYNEGYGNPAICKLTGQVMAHRAAIIAIASLLKNYELLDQAAVKLLAQHLTDQASAVLDVARESPPGTRTEHDTNHTVAGFETEAQAIVDALIS